MVATRGQVPTEPARRRPRSTRFAATLVASVTLTLAGCGLLPAGQADDLRTAASATPAAPASRSTASTSKADQPLLTTAPDDRTEVGELVSGFPIDLLPVPADAVILVTSAVPVGDAEVQEVSLNFRTTMTAEELVEMYRTALVGAGFVEIPSPSPAPGLAAESTFTRSGGDELVSVGVVDADGARTLTIGGRVHTTS
jgi:hypothetical protein